MKKINRSLFAGVIMMILSSCHPDKKDDCKPVFFDGNVFLTDSHSLSFKLLGSISMNNKCGFLHELELGPSYVTESGEAYPELSVKGVLFKKGNAIFLTDSNGNTIKYFDFDMKVGHQDTIDRKQLSGNSRKYILTLVDKFHEDYSNDTVYKFRFSKISIHRGDIVFYVSPSNGVYGLYNGNTVGDSIEHIYSSAGVILYKSEHQKTKRINAINEGFE